MCKCMCKRMLCYVHVYACVHINMYVRVTDVFISVLFVYDYLCILMSDVCLYFAYAIYLCIFVFLCMCLQMYTSYCIRMRKCIVSLCVCLCMCTDTYCVSVRVCTRVSHLYMCEHMCNSISISACAYV